jgi:hypothetical protein
VVLLQLGGVVARLTPMPMTRPITEALHVRGAKPQASDEPFLEIFVDDKQCAVHCRGRFLDLREVTARTLHGLCLAPGRPIDADFLRTLVGADSNIQQAVSRLRRALRQLVDDGHVDVEEIRHFIRTSSIGERLSEIDSLDLSALMRRFILSKRRVGYVLMLPADAVRIVDTGA